MPLEFTMPPSLNGLFAWKKRRYKSDEYKNWIALATYELSQQTSYKITGNEWLEINLTYFTQILNKDWTHKKKDLDNYFSFLNKIQTSSWIL